LRRRTTTSRLTPAGSGRGERLDPFPLRCAVADHAGDEDQRLLEPSRERAVPRRAGRGITTALKAPLTAYRGVAIRMQPPTHDAAGAVAVVLEHSDPALSLTLYHAAHGIDVVAEWRAGGRALMLPLLVAEADGRLREPFERIGAVRVAPPASRRRGRSALKARRPTLRRRQGAVTTRPVVHRGERELIARN
jgi:Family of unknown function (DUF6101)